MTTELARQPDSGGLGLEVGILAEVYRNCSLKRVCQVELVENYDYKHQVLSSTMRTPGPIAWSAT